MSARAAAPSPRTLTYKQAADVQPFANTLVNVDLTGAQIKTVLEQQWQPAGASRPFLKLGISKGFTYTFDDPQAGRVADHRDVARRTPIDPADGLLGDRELVPAVAATTSSRSTTARASRTRADGPAGHGRLHGGVRGWRQVGPPDYRQNGVGVTFPAGAPASYEPGAHVKFDVSSWAMTNALDTKDTGVMVKAGTAALGTFALDNALRPRCRASTRSARPRWTWSCRAPRRPGVLTLTLTVPTPVRRRRCRSRSSRRSRRPRPRSSREAQGRQEGGPLGPRHG